MTTNYEIIDSVAIDRYSIPQHRLDLSVKTRKNFFSWRGQFSPEFVDLLITSYAEPESVILDPFVGSGTTLFEAVRNSISCIGVEINPAAVEMAKTVQFVNLHPQQREQIIEIAKQIVQHFTHLDSTRFFIRCSKLNDGVIKEMLLASRFNPLVHNIILNSIFHYYASHARKVDDLTKFVFSFQRHVNFIRSLPFMQKAVKVFHSDARSLPIEDESVELVITSPPYINVFNYHQNYRKVMEMVGWDMLKIAKSEIGSNRKNRGNRFLTVIQYSIDMFLALREMRRVLKPDGRLILVIGRESKIKGVSFENYRILATLAVELAQFDLIARQERKFTNRFGKLIYEDILHLKPVSKDGGTEDDAREIGVEFLKRALKNAPSDKVLGDIKTAIANAHKVERSPIFKPDNLLGGIEANELDAA